MTNISKNAELQQSCITAVMPSTAKVNNHDINCDKVSQ